MKKRFLSLFLAFVMLLGILPISSFAASSEDEALGEVDIFNGDHEIGYLSINGSVRKGSRRSRILIRKKARMRSSAAMMDIPARKML